MRRTKWKSRFLRPAVSVEHEDVFLEFLIDGLPLVEVLEVGANVSAPLDEVSDLGDFSSAEAVLQLDRLLGVEANQFGSDRTWLLFCPTCHQERCGGLSVKIERREGIIVWSEFAWDNIDGEPPLVLSSTQKFTFDARAYDEELNKLREQFAAST